MPQFDLSQYSSQIFWLFISCTVLMVFLKFFLIPSIERIFKKRQFFLETETEKIECTQKKLEEIEHTRQLQIRDAEQEIKNLLLKTQNELEIEKEINLNKLEANLQEQLKDLELDLQKEFLNLKNMYHQELNSYLKALKKNII